MWESIKEIIGEGAPIIGGLLGGKAGGAVGELIASALGVDNSPESIEKALKNNPDAMIKLRELENSKEIAILQAQLESKRIDIEDKRVDNETEKLFLDDKGSARAREIDTTKATGKRDYALYVLASVIVTAFFVSMWLLIQTPLVKDSGSYELLLIMFGALGAKFSTVVDYFFGASKK